jgi:hypothetical protein
MKQEYVLPKFRIPGQPNWLVRGVWALAGVVTISLGALGVAYWRRTAAATVQQPVAQLPVAPAPAAPPPAAPAAATKPGAPVAPAAPAAKPVGMGKLALNKRPGARFGAGRYHRYGKGKLGARARGGKRALAARRAYLRKKRLLAARRAHAGWPAKPVAGAGGGLAGARGRTPTPSAATANKAKAGDPIDDILRNFK